MILTIWMLNISVLAIMTMNQLIDLRMIHLACKSKTPLQFHQCFLHFSKKEFTSRPFNKIPLSLSCLDAKKTERHCHVLFATVYSSYVLEIFPIDQCAINPCFYRKNVPCCMQLFFDKCGYQRLLQGFLIYKYIPLSQRPKTDSNK